MRRSARGDNSAFSLFPFLAVLLCTMGSLVVLLAAMAYVAREKAQAEAEAVAAAAEQAAQEADTPERRQAEATLAEAERLAKEMAERVQQREEVLRQQQKRLSDLEDHLRRLRDEADRLKAETVELLAVEEDYYADEKQAREELERRNRLIGELQDEIEQLKHAATGRERKYAVVTLRDERTGTARPPIYFECTKQGVIIQPEGIALAHEDLVAATVSSPVSAAARAVTRYYEEHPEARAANEVGAPYPLLLVRPDGVAAYYRTRDALDSIGADFGYQPIGADWPLEFDSPNPVLAQWVNEEVLLAREERRGLAGVMPELANAIANATPHPRMGQRVQLPPGTGGGAENGSVVVRRADPEANNPFEGLTIVGAVPPSEGSGSPPSLGKEATSNPFTAGVASEGPNGVGGPQSGAAQGSLAATPYQQIPTPVGRAVSPPGAESTGTAASGASQPAKPSQSGPSGGGGSESKASTAAAGQAQQAASATFTAATPAQTPDAPASVDGDQPGTQSEAPKRSGIPMVRPIRLYVTSEQVVVLPDRAQSPEEGAQIASSSQRIDFIGPTTLQINQVVSALKSHADSWGIAGQGMYWEPRLVLNVSSDGQGRAKELTRLLRAAGLKVQSKPLATAAKPSTRRAANATR